MAWTEKRHGNAVFVFFMGGDLTIVLQQSKHYYCLSMLLNGVYVLTQKGFR